MVHGGALFGDPVLVDDDVLRQIRDLSVLAPLHNPANADGIEQAMAAFPGMPQVAVFDTAFFLDLPAAAATYAIDRDGGGRAPDPPVRLPRHLAPVRLRVWSPRCSAATSAT